MDENQTEGAAKVAVGKLESVFGEALGDGAMQLRGAGLQVEGHVQEVAGSVQEAFGEVADRTSAAVSKAGEAYGRVRAAARDLAQRVGEKPYLALGLAAGAGLLLGQLVSGRGPKVIYVRPRA